MPSRQRPPGGATRRQKPERTQADGVHPWGSEQTSVEGACWGEIPSEEPHEAHWLVMALETELSCLRTSILLLLTRRDSLPQPSPWGPRGIPRRDSRALLPRCGV